MPVVENFSPPTEIHIANTALTPATSQDATEGGIPVTPVQFESEKNYQAARQIAENFRKQGLLTMRNLLKLILFCFRNTSHLWAYYSQKVLAIAGLQSDV